MTLISRGLMEPTTTAAFFSPGAGSQAATRCLNSISIVQGNQKKNMPIDFFLELM